MGAFEKEYLLQTHPQSVIHHVNVMVCLKEQLMEK